MVLVSWIAITFVVLVFSKHSGASPAGSVPEESMMHQTVLDTEANYILRWTPREHDIIFEIHVATTGYVGLGFSPGGGMKNADIILGWVDDITGEVILHDRFSPGYGVPIIDKTQDVELLSGYQNDTHTMLKFRRLWNTCDRAEDFKMANDTIRVIWAYGYNDPEGDMNLMIHNKRGTKSMYLNDPPFVMPDIPEDVKSWDLTVNNVSLPNMLNTMYWCKIYKIPPLTKKAHVIGFVPDVQKENVEHVHHIVVYRCLLPDDADLEPWIEIEGAQCRSGNMPPLWSYCSTPLIAWAVGSEGEMYPEHVGFPIGEEDGVSDYFMIEMHYDNPNLRQNIIDSSGLKLFYTEKLRQYDAGNAIVGHSFLPPLMIPPGQHWLTIGHCVSECTERVIPPEGVNIFHGLLHSHLLGTKLRLRHIRDGKELPPVLEDMAYDFNFQQNRVLREEIKILPGDQLMIECTYDSTHRDKPTFGGLSTDEEMCIAFLAYYPLTDFAICASSPSLKNLYQSVGFEEIYMQDKKGKNKERGGKKAAKLNPGNFTTNYEEFKHWHWFKSIKAKSPEKFEGVTLFDVLNADDVWQDADWVSNLQNMTVYGEHHIACFDGIKLAKQNLTGVPKMTSFPNFIPLEDNETCDAQ